MCAQEGKKQIFEAVGMQIDRKLKLQMHWLGWSLGENAQAGNEVFS